MRRTTTILLALAFALACHREKPAPQGYSGAQPQKPATATGSAPQKTATEAATPPTEVGDTMPAYSATYLDGKPFDLTAERGRNVVFLNVWATWCGPCRFEIPELQKMHDKYASKGFEVIGVSVDGEGADAVRPFLQQQKIGYPIVLDPNGKIASLLQTTVLPTSVLIDRDGKIVWRRIGALIGEDAALNEALETSLK